MSPTAMRANPFMLLLHPEVVVAAMEKSERLSQLNRHLCRPLDRVLPGTAVGDEVQGDEDESQDLVFTSR
ncbi:MAG TPA: hypothetical protein PLA97_05160 [Rubrivivax sp.]|nr:hypothetical protein [Rubrivivax sp.]